MSRRRQTARRPNGEETSAPAGLPASSPSRDSVAGLLRMDRRSWIILYVVVFLLVEIGMVLAFTGLGGDSRIRRKWLQEVDSLRAAGRHAEALDSLERFAERWPGALDTHPFNVRLADELAALGRSEEAAMRYIQATLHDPSKWGTRSRAGEELWKAGRKDDAVTLFRMELLDANANDDAAHYHLGMHALQTGNLPEAAAQFQAIAAPEAYARELAEARRILEDTILLPARVKAKAAVLPEPEQPG